MAKTQEMQKVFGNIFKQLSVLLEIFNGIIYGPSSSMTDKNVMKVLIAFSRSKGFGF